MNDKLTFTLKTPITDEQLDKTYSDVVYRQDAIDAIIKQKVIDKSVAHRILLQLPSVGTYNDIYKQGWNDGRAELQKEMWKYERESDE